MSYNKLSIKWIPTASRSESSSEIQFITLRLLVLRTKLPTALSTALCAPLCLRLLSIKATLLLHLVVCLVNYLSASPLDMFPGRLL
jgi:hypothetical protein